MKKISISLFIGMTFVLLLLVLPPAFGSFPSDITAPKDGASVYTTVALSCVISILVAGLFFLLTSRRASTE